MEAENITCPPTTFWFPIGLNTAAAHFLTGPRYPNNGYETGVASGSENGAPFYLCRAAVDPAGAVVLTGKVNQNVRSCSIAYNGAEHWIGTYQVLTDRYNMQETVVR